ncbi:hypothetical protein [Actinokineospora terrae]|uniref:Uncharacterized protein n=1 Tax=Actinokineospora terrae TaxID=155974 RepID=A0A1H9M855_9PSEU|nr:hypothetical protein [Actinokineospora terrae]SER19802.1 hypothetical protein SAMN04487818_10211 [Actinokineospora terrae]
MPAVATPTGYLFRPWAARVAVAAMNQVYRSVESDNYGLWIGEHVVIVDRQCADVRGYVPEMVRPSRTGHYAVGDRATWVEMD